ncbi:hypothetical protein OsJ_00081 [Oryza sativa Japonica Group]|uniref:Uncharacterized protein n=1 Tax=Oryza sativa subsp. japonica TaxID=39947 RepID=B9EYU5_ORYSJ|nr:hypothetical protein OsJ_00081 [Oryza sativa Japonica Group]
MALLRQWRRGLALAALLALHLALAAAQSPAAAPAQPTPTPAPTKGKNKHRKKDKRGKKAFGPGPEPLSPTGPAALSPAENQADVSGPAPSAFDLNGSNRQYGQWGFVLQTVMAALLLSLAW